MTKHARAPRKLVCLETYWSDRHVQAFRERSVRPFFEGLAAQLEPPLAIAHRFIDSPAQLAAYTRHREGLLWRDPETFDTPVYYLSFHGSPGKIHTALTKIGPAALCRAFAGYTTDVNWMDSMLTDLLFLRRFYADPDPWRNLRRIHDSVLEDFAPARALGHVLHIGGR